MTKVLEIKNKIFKFYGEYETFLFPVVKFIVALAVFLCINRNIGFMERITSPSYAIVLALLCTILPVNAMVWFSGILILLNMYALSLLVAIVTLVVLIIIFMVYFRFAPRDGIIAVLTPVMFRFNIPYIMPIGTALFRKASSVIGIICGTVIYYFIEGIKQNSSALVELSSDKETEITSKLNVIIGQIFNKPEMYLVITVFTISTLVVYMVRRLKVDHSWILAIIIGTVIQFAGLLVGYIRLGITGNTVKLIVGSIICMLIGFVMEFLFMNLDYERTERVQFEDDDYFYYVKAVPKKMVTKEEKVVKTFGNTASIGKKIEKVTSDTTVIDEAASRKILEGGIDTEVEE